MQGSVICYWMSGVLCVPYYVDEPLILIDCILCYVLHVCFSLQKQCCVCACEISGNCQKLFPPLVISDMLHNRTIGCVGMFHTLIWQYGQWIIFYPGGRGGRYTRLNMGLNMGVWTKFFVLCGLLVSCTSRLAGNIVSF